MRPSTGSTVSPRRQSPNLAERGERRREEGREAEVKEERGENEGEEPHACQSAHSVSMDWSWS